MTDKVVTASGNEYLLVKTLEEKQAARLPIMKVICNQCGFTYHELSALKIILGVEYILQYVVPIMVTGICPSCGTNESAIIQITDSQYYEGETPVMVDATKEEIAEKLEQVKEVTHVE